MKVAVAFSSIALVLFCTAERIHGSTGGGSGTPGSCSALSPPYYGALLYNGSLVSASQQPEWRENDTVTFICNRGYLLRGQRTQQWSITCEGIGASGSGSGSGSDSGGWSQNPEQFQCTSVDCGAPYSVVNGTVTYTSTDLFSTAVYSCNPGHEIAGVSTVAVCWWHGVWVPNNLSCNASTTMCTEAPPIIDNGAREWAEGNTAEIGTTVIYTCDSGYDLNGATLVTCDISGRWTPPPSCSATAVLSSSEIYAIEGAAAAVVISILLAALFFASCFICRIKIKQRRYIEDEEALASTGAFTLSNPLVKDEDAAGNPLYLTPDELNEFEQQH